MAATVEMRFTARTDVVLACRDVAAIAATEEKQFVAVVVDGRTVEAIGAYAKHATADGMCTRALRGAAATVRAFTVAPRAGGGVVVMAGPVVFGSTRAA